MDLVVGCVDLYGSVGSHTVVAGVGQVANVEAARCSLGLRWRTKSITQHSGQIHVISAFLRHLLHWYVSLLPLASCLRLVLSCLFFFH